MCLKWGPSLGPEVKGPWKEECSFIYVKSLESLVLLYPKEMDRYSRSFRSVTLDQWTGFYGTRFGYGRIRLRNCLRVSLAELN